MRQPLIVGNWKMHGFKSSVLELMQSLARQVLPDSTGVVVCPPYLYLSQAKAALRGSVIRYGAQDLCGFEAAQGAYTGDVSAAMLADVGCEFVIVGHSERRAYYLESDEQVADKFINAQKADLKPILCVGESLEQREAGIALTVIAGQLNAVLTRVGIDAMQNAAIAYEPVWAIGTGKTASPQQAQEVHVHIRQLLAELDNKIAAGVSILYGGSVKADNAALLFAESDIDGALVGGASLEAAEFAAICRATE